MTPLDNAIIHRPNAAIFDSIKSVRTNSSTLASLYYSLRERRSLYRVQLVWVPIQLEVASIKSRRSGRPWVCGYMPRFWNHIGERYSAYIQ